MNVVVVVVAGGHGGEIDVLTPVAGVPLLVRSVESVLRAGVVESVVVLVAPQLVGPAVEACAGLPVDVRAGDLRGAVVPVGAHARQRAGSLRGDGPVTVVRTPPDVSAPPDVVLVHDAARPLTPPQLFTAVIDAVRAGHGIVVPVLPLADTVKQVDADDVVRGTPDRSGLRVVQTPFALRADVLAAAGPGAVPLDLAAELAAAGAVVHTLPGDPQAFAVRSRWDLELAELLLERNDT